LRHGWVYSDIIAGQEDKKNKGRVMTHRGKSSAEEERRRGALLIVGVGVDCGERELRFLRLSQGYK
jgi:hypothetical protein